MEKNNEQQIWSSAVAHCFNGTETLSSDLSCYPRQDYVSLAMSPRAGGLSIEVNLNPDRYCNFNCAYCDVDRTLPTPQKRLDIDIMAAELSQTLSLAHSGQLHLSPGFTGLQPELLKLRHVALSGDGEPTLCPEFARVVEAVVHVRARGLFPFFKIVLLTNGTRLDLPDVARPLKLLTREEDEVWIKLETGTQHHFERINRPEQGYLLEKVLANILLLGKQRPVVIQSLFPSLDGATASAEEVQQYTLRLKDLKAAGAQIKLVQIYSAHPSVAVPGCRHVPLQTLSTIARTVRKETGLPVEFY